MNHHFYIVDVFAEQQYSGNPLAVIISDEFMPTETMQKIAAETNYSETTFVLAQPEDDHGYRVRVFTPVREIDFTGHPILGTAWVIRQYLQTAAAASEVQLNLSIGPITVKFEASNQDPEIAWFCAPSITLGASTTRESIAESLNLQPDDIATSSPVQMASASTAAMIVPVNSLDALERSKLNLKTYATLASKGFPPLTYLFCQQTRDNRNHLAVRFFFEANEVREDPATGNGAAFLGAYLLTHKTVTIAEPYLRIEQGHHLQRPSLIFLKAQGSAVSQNVSVGGYVSPIAQGILC